MIRTWLECVKALSQPIPPSGTSAGFRTLTQVLEKGLPLTYAALKVLPSLELRDTVFEGLEDLPLPDIGLHVTEALLHEDDPGAAAHGAEHKDVVVRQLPRTESLDLGGEVKLGDLEDFFGDYGAGDGDGGGGGGSGYGNNDALFVDHESYHPPGVIRGTDNEDWAMDFNSLPHDDTEDENESRDEPAGKAGRRTRARTRARTRVRVRAGARTRARPPERPVQSSPPIPVFDFNEPAFQHAHSKTSSRVVNSSGLGDLSLTAEAGSVLTARPVYAYLASMPTFLHAVSTLNRIQTLDHLAVYHRFAFANRAFAKAMAETHVLSMEDRTTRLLGGTRPPPDNQNRNAKVLGMQHEFGALLPIPGVNHLRVVRPDAWADQLKLVAESSLRVCTPKAGSPSGFVDLVVSKHASTIVRSMCPFNETMVCVSIAEVGTDRLTTKALGVGAQKSTTGVLIDASIAVRINTNKHASDDGVDLVAYLPERKQPATKINLGFPGFPHILTASLQIMGSAHAVIQKQVGPLYAGSPNTVAATERVIAARVLRNNDVYNLSSGKTNAVVQSSNPLVSMPPGVPLAYLLHLALLANAKYLKIRVGANGVAPFTETCMRISPDIVGNLFTVVEKLHSEGQWKDVSNALKKVETTLQRNQVRVLVHTLALGNGSGPEGRMASPPLCTYVSSKLETRPATEVGETQFNPNPGLENMWATKTRKLPLCSGSPLNARLLNLPSDLPKWVVLVSESPEGTPSVFITTGVMRVRLLTTAGDVDHVLLVDPKYTKSFNTSEVLQATFSNLAWLQHRKDDGKFFLYSNIKDAQPSVLDVTLLKTETHAKSKEILTEYNIDVSPLNFEDGISFEEALRKTISRVESFIEHGDVSNDVENAKTQACIYAMADVCFKTLSPNNGDLTKGLVQVAAVDAYLTSYISKDNGELTFQITADAQWNKNRGLSSKPWGTHRGALPDSDELTVMMPMTSVYGVWATEEEAVAAATRLLSTPRAVAQVTVPVDCCTFAATSARGAPVPREDETVFADPVNAVRYMCEVGAAPKVVQLDQEIVGEDRRVATLVGHGLGAMRLVAAECAAPMQALLPVRGQPRKSPLDYVTPSPPGGAGGSAGGGSSTGSAGSADVEFSWGPESQTERNTRFGDIVEAAIGDMAANRLEEMLDPASGKAYHHYVLNSGKFEHKEDIVHGTTLARFANGGCNAPTIFVLTKAGCAIATTRAMVRGEPLEVQYHPVYAPWLESGDLCYCRSCITTAARRLTEEDTVFDTTDAPGAEASARAGAGAGAGSGSGSGLEAGAEGGPSAPLS